MSEILLLAKQLRALSDAELAKVIRRRVISGKPKDFLELAQSLLTPKSIELCLATLTFSELQKLQNLPLELGVHNSLFTTGLVYLVDEKVHLTDSAKPLVSQLRLAQHKPSRESVLGDTAALAAIAIFETQQAITELLLDVETRRVRVVGKGAIGLPEVKNLAQQLHKSLDFARGCYSIAQSIGLIRPSDSRWWLTSLAKNWLSQDPTDRWQVLAANWFNAIGELAAEELSHAIKKFPGAGLRDLLGAVFPVADSNLLSQRLADLTNQAEWLGLTVSGIPTDAMLAMLSGDTESAIKSISTHLPKPQRKLLAQGDQTLIAPGPLPTDLEITVRDFAELEQVSVASTYRITPASITYALECGMTDSQIRQLLAELTGAPLPQPIDYLIAQAASRFGRIKITASSGLERSIVQASTTALLSEILNDQRLRAFAFHPISASSLASRFEPEVIYFGLREHGFLAIRVDSEGKVISPKESISWQIDSEIDPDPAISLVAELRQTESRIGENPSDDDLARQLQLAIKSRATLKVHLQLRDGTVQAYELKVSSLANGRLRGKDSKADAERVLPLSQIIRVEF